VPTVLKATKKYTSKRWQGFSDNIVAWFKNKWEEGEKWFTKMASKDWKKYKWWLYLYWLLLLLCLTVSYIYISLYYIRNQQGKLYSLMIAMINSGTFEQNQELIPIICKRYMENNSGNKFGVLSFRYHFRTQKFNNKSCQ